MGKTSGYRHGTRSKFKRKFRKHGMPKVAIYLRPFRIGDIVDVKCNSAIQGGMPHSYYHGRTGVVWNITPRAVGVEINKRVGGAIMRKRFHVRIEHVVKSNCRNEFLQRVKKNQQVQIKSKEQGIKVSLKRTPKLPREGKIININTKIENLKPKQYVESW